MGFLGRNEDSKILKESAFIFPSWKMREEYRSSRDIGYLAPVWYDEENSLIFPMGHERKTLTGESAILCKKRQMTGQKTWGGVQIPTLGGFCPKCKKEKKRKHTEGDLSCQLTLS